MNITNRRIALNTIILYMRSILIMIISLYIVRRSLFILGVVDYGIYNIIAGVVLMLSFLTSSLAASSQRFFSFEIGRNNTKAIQELFNQNVLIYFILIVFMILIMETIGLWFIKNKIVLPENKLTESLILYEISLVSLIFSILSTPYLSLLIAYEKMSYYAFVSILDISLKFLSIQFVSFFYKNKLIYYSIFLSLSSMLIFTVYKIICNKKYPESKIKFQINTYYVKKLISFISWNFIGTIAGLIKVHGTNIVLNLFFGPIINTSKAISSQVNSAITSFSINFSTAIRPNMAKLYSQGKFTELINFVFKSCKYTFFLMYIFTIPLIFNIEILLKFWLVELPEYVKVFTVLVLVDSLIESLSYPLMGLIQATGKIRLYQSVLGGLTILNIPISYILLKSYSSPLIIFYVMIILSILSYFIRLIIIRKAIFFSYGDYGKLVFFPIVLVVVVSLMIIVCFQQYIHNKMIGVIISIVLCTITNLLAIYFFGLDKTEKTFALNKISSILTS